MTINPVSAADTVSAPALKADPLGRNAFLSLLVTQLQHQDPLSPQADGEFLAQLAQFSSLEQLQQINKDVSTLVGVLQAVQTNKATPSEGGA